MILILDAESARQMGSSQGLSPVSTAMGSLHGWFGQLWNDDLSP